MNKMKKRSLAKVGIAGCGGLGSNSAHCLVRSGINQLIVADFDEIEESNLNRQFYFKDQVGLPKSITLAENLKRINPDLKIKPLTQKLSRDNFMTHFGDCHIVIEAFDKAEEKKWIIEECQRHKKPLVSVSGIGGVGNSDDIIIRRLKDTLWLIGDLKTACEGDTPAAAPRVVTAAAKQADTVLHWIEEELCLIPS